MPICYVQPVIDLAVRDLCCQPYPNHPRGCPNYGKRSTCPPEAPIFSDIFDLTKPLLAVWEAFNLELHREKMQTKHPSWTRRQLDCCLYWQNRLNKHLRKEVQYNLTRPFLFDNKKKLIFTFTPEAMGVNVTVTMRNSDVILEWPPDRTVIKVAIIGVAISQTETKK